MIRSQQPGSGRFEASSRRTGSLGRRCRLSGFPTSADLQLVQNAVDVVLDGCRAHRKVVGDVLVGMALARKREDFVLATRQNWQGFVPPIQTFCGTLDRRSVVDTVRGRFGWQAVGYGSGALEAPCSVPDEFRELAEKDL
jgi:DNA polymerase-4